MRYFWAGVALVGLVGTATVAGATTEAALRQAAKQNKHLFALFIRSGEPQSAKMKSVFTEAQRSLGQRALFHVAAVSDPAEADFVRKNGIGRASLPLTLVFAPNGAVVKGFPGQVVSKEALAAAFASPKLADVLKGLQDKRLVLLCVQGKKTKHNAESLRAAREVAKDERARGGVTVVQAAPEDARSADLFRQLKAGTSFQEATVFIVAPPSSLAGTVAGKTTKEALWTAIVKGVSACSSGGCGPSGCGP